MPEEFDIQWAPTHWRTVATFYSSADGRSVSDRDLDPEAREITVTLLDQEGTTDEGLEEYRDKLSALLRKIPADRRHTATIRLDSTTDYDSHTATTEIAYTRLETAKEVAARVSRATEFFADMESKKEERERKEFERLQAKFASDSDTRPKDGDAKQGSTRE